MINKKTISVIALYAILLFAFNIIYFFIPFPKTPAAWVCYGFSTFAVLLTCGITFVAFSNGRELRSKVYGFPIFRIGMIYLTAQFTLTLTILVIGFFANVPTWIPVVISVVDLAYVLVGVIVGENARDIIQQQENEVKQSTQQVTYFRIDMAYIVDMCNDPALKKSLTKLLDEFKYSDPVSNPQLKDIEENIKCEVGQLQSLVNEDNNAAQEKVVLITRLLADRNRRCKAFKS